jgi:hypothetical protein
MAIAAKFLFMVLPPNRLATWHPLATVQVRSLLMEEGC